MKLSISLLLLLIACTVQIQETAPQPEPPFNATTPDFIENVSLGCESHYTMLVDLYTHDFTTESFASLQESIELAIDTCQFSHAAQQQDPGCSRVTDTQAKDICEQYSSEVSELLDDPMGSSTIREFVTAPNEQVCQDNVCRTTYALLTNQTITCATIGDYPCLLAVAVYRHDDGACEWVNHNDYEKLNCLQLFNQSQSKIASQQSIVREKVQLDVRECPDQICIIVQALTTGIPDYCEFSNDQSLCNGLVAVAKDNPALCKSDRCTEIYQDYLSGSMNKDRFIDSMIATAQG